MGLYRKRPVVISAEQYNDYSSAPQEGVCGYGLTCPDLDDLHVHTLEGVLKVSHGDWIIRGVQGEFYPCKDDIFRLTYEPADVEATA